LAKQQHCSRVENSSFQVLLAGI